MQLSTSALSHHHESRNKGKSGSHNNSRSGARHSIIIPAGRVATGQLHFKAARRWRKQRLGHTELYWKWGCAGLRTTVPRQSFSLCTQPAFRTAHLASFSSLTLATNTKATQIVPNVQDESQWYFWPRPVICLRSRPHSGLFNIISICIPALLCCRTY